MMLRICYFLILFPVLILCASEYTRHDFPAAFIFGSGTSSYQVEGAAYLDGKGVGNMGGVTADVSVDQYHKYKEDVKLMAQSSLDAYRFSISWSRLIPNGRGAVNPMGLQYYNNLINELITHGIQPHVTIYHFDHPQVLEDEYGGWLSRKIVKDFTEYAQVCFREFGDRVSHWTTLNEPNAITLLGYDAGTFPPNRCSLPLGVNCTKGNSSYEPYLVAHHILLAHASAVKLYREKYQGKQGGLIGINVLALGTAPLTNSVEDVLATQRANDYWVGLIMHPVVFGDYPATVKKNTGLRLPVFTNHESKLLKGSFDFVGVNHYSSVLIKDNPSILNLKFRDIFVDMAVDMIAPGITNTSFEFPITPWGMQAVLEYFKKEYGNPPIYIHENGQMTKRTSSLDDTSRVEYLEAYIGSVLDSIRNGSNTRGYFTWALLDVFEFFGGYDMCYGLYYVDLEDPELKRVPKLSAHWYSHFLKGGIVTGSSSDGLIQLPNNLSPLSLTHLIK
ncbi:beta-glucosidase 11-like isoform X2 [Euphorbia lathyris]|uniref:beta-glucosidase 11-like isoform X2 n=1 Tax=Euphorbia lathyris TaxID=212925 RepID=UPI003313238B